jgi:hypothetical protein
VDRKGRLTCRYLADMALIYTWFCTWRWHYVQQWKIPSAPFYIIFQDTCSASTPDGPMNIQILFPCNIVEGQRTDVQEEQ